MKKLLALLLSALLISCATNERVPIDQVPMYGGMDRSKYPDLAAADKRLIEGTTKEFGSRRAASEAFADRAFRLYQADDLAGAMRRFNQAWLIDESNPEVYHGFGSILYDQGDNCGAMEIMNRSLDMDWGARWPSRPGFLADLAMITSLCASAPGFEKWGTRESLTERSDALFAEAEQAAPSSAYLYDKWWQALYWRADYADAWDKVFQMRLKGGEPHPKHLQALESKMAEPAR